MSKDEKVKIAGDIPWAKKASVFLLLLDDVLRNLKSASVTQEICEEAIGTCWLWLSDRGVSADKLAYYLDSDEMQSGPLAEENFASGSVAQNSLNLILLVVGFFANKAYRIAGQQEKISESICEADEGAEAYIIGYIDRVGLSDRLKIYLHV